MEVYQTSVGSSLDLELFDGQNQPLDLTLYDESNSFIRLEYPSGTIDKSLRFGENNWVYYDVKAGDFDEVENVRAQVFMRKIVNEELVRLTPLAIFVIQVLPVLPAPEVVP